MRGRPRPHLDPLAAPPRLLARAMQRAQQPPSGRHGSAARFAAAVALAAERGGAAEDADVLRALREAPVMGMGRIVYSSNAAFLLELEARDPADASRPLRGVYKPTRGERPLWDFPHRTLHFREVGTYLVDAALGFGLTPPTVLRDGPLGPGSVQLFVDVRDRPLTDEEQAALQGPLHDLAALDALVNNADRKSAHLVVTDKGALRGIDNGLTFLPYPRQRTVLLELGGDPLPEPTAAGVLALHGDIARRTALLEHLGLMLDADEVEAFAARLAELAEDPVYPVLDPWDGRPFEWW